MADEAHEQISVAAAPEQCWAIATDYERYPEWAKDVKHAAVLFADQLEVFGHHQEFRQAAPYNGMVVYEKNFDCHEVLLLFIKT
jgi:hypothetical protein